MSSAPTFSAPPRRTGAASGAAAPVSFSSFGRSLRSETGTGGGGASSRSEFDSAAAAAFGKKPARTFDEPAPAVAPPKVAPARNTLASVLDTLLPPEPEPKEREWSRSALQQQRKAAAAEKAAKPMPPKSYDEEFPTLGSGKVGGASTAAVRVPKPVFASGGVGSDSKTTAGSFASLAANWAKSDEERKAAEAYAARLRLEQQQREEYERSLRTNVYFNRNSHSQYNVYDHHEDNYYDNDDEYPEGELGEDEYKDRGADRRAAANHYSDEEEEDEDNYNIGCSSTAW